MKTTVFTLVNICRERIGSYLSAVSWWWEKYGSFYYKTIISHITDCSTGIKFITPNLIYLHNIWWKSWTINPYMYDRNFLNAICSTQYDCKTHAYNVMPLLNVQYVQLCTKQDVLMSVTTFIGVHTWKGIFDKVVNCVVYFYSVNLYLQNGHLISQSGLTYLNIPKTEKYCTFLSNC